MATPDLGQLLIWYGVFVVSLTLHEAAHALVAFWGGDETAYRGGQVSLNPWPHMKREPMGMVLVPLITFATSGFTMGWASAPFNPLWARLYPRRAAAMAAAGPASNLLLCLLSFVVLKVLVLAGVFDAPIAGNSSHLVEATGGRVAEGLGQLLSVALSLNLVLFLLNLVPFPPLDGAGIVRGLFPDSAGRVLDQLRANPVFSLLGLIAAWKVLSLLERPAIVLVLNLLHPGHNYG